MFDADFPIIDNYRSRGVYYFDSASTTLKLKGVIEAVNSFYLENTSNVFRGLHSISELNSELVENTRSIVGSYLGCAKDEIIFTHNSSDSINIVAELIDVANGFILLSEVEHHSNFLPWKTRAKIKTIKKYEGHIAIEDLEWEGVKCVAISLLSNVSGNYQDVQALIKVAHQRNIPVLVDATQAIAHSKVNVRSLDCDFCVFSGHKVFAPSGVGVLYMNKKYSNKLRPIRTGGGMVSIIDHENIIFKLPPYCYEVGTPNIEGIIGLGRAIEFLSKNQSAVFEKLKILDNYFQKRIYSELGVQPLFKLLSPHAPIHTVSLSNEVFSDLDISMMLASKYKIMLSYGYQCAQPLYRQSGLKGGIRFSLQCYNSLQDIDYLANALSELIGLSIIHRKK